MTSQVSPDHGPSRRNVVCGFAAAGMAVPLLGACGMGGGSDKPVAGDVKASGIPVGGGTIFAEKNFVVTQPAKGQFKAFSAVCTHQHCLVTTVTDGKIHCGCHGSEFSIADGSVEHGPATEPLPPVPLKVTGSTLAVG